MQLYWSAHYDPRGSINCWKPARTWQKLKSHKVLLYYVCVCVMTTLSTCNDKNKKKKRKRGRMMWQSFNLPSTCSWTATKHFSNDIFAHNYLLITRRTYAGPSCYGIWCVKECEAVCDAPLGYQMRLILTPTTAVRFRYPFKCIFEKNVVSENAF